MAQDDRRCTVDVVKYIRCPKCDCSSEPYRVTMTCGVDLRSKPSPYPRAGYTQRAMTSHLYPMT